MVIQQTKPQPSDAGALAERAASMLVLHAAWTDDALHIWGETDRPPLRDEPGAHPRCATPGDLRDALGIDGSEDSIEVRLPSVDASEGPTPALSPRLAHWLGEGDAEAPTLSVFRVPTLRIAPDDAEAVLDAAEERGELGGEGWADEATGHEEEKPLHVVVGPSVRFFATAARFARALLAGQKVVPSVLQALDGPLRGAWEPWLADESIAPRASKLMRSMPASARAPVDEFDHDPPAILRHFLESLIDAACRKALIAQAMREAIDGKTGADDPHVGWLHGLLDEERRVVAEPDSVTDMVRSVRHWVGRLDDRGISVDWRLLLRVDEPLVSNDEMGFQTPDDSTLWTISFCLQSLDNEDLIIEAEEIWSLRADSATVEGQRVDKPQELLLGELARAARLFPALESALAEQTPVDLRVPTREAYGFLREVAPLLREQNVEVVAPGWWDTPGARLGARLQLFDAPDGDMSGSGASPSSAAEARLGLNALVGYEWSLAVGDTPISMEDFERLAGESAPLVRINGRWVEVRKEDIQHAVDFIKENPGGAMRFGEALRMAYAYDSTETGMPIMGIDASGWVASLLGQDTSDKATFQMLEAPKGFVGELRPYQLKGLSWMAFLDRLGLGPCLADDMGLGKTIQLLALLQHEKNDAEAQNIPTVPTLLVVPMSIVGNWTRESNKFAPGLRVLVHHGVERKTGDSFVEAAGDSDIVITTYALAHRDHDLLDRIPWGRLVLDEAQNVKNASAKQSQAVRTLDAPRRIALTGTPLENRLSELWSIIDFCNPGFLGSAGDFRRTFGVPIERHRDKHKAARLRQLVRPFILRRLKTDPKVITDLPDKVETREYCRLTPEQATLYESAVKTMLTEVDRSEGIRRRGVVLTALIRLKQICNHPQLVAKANAKAAGEEIPEDPIGPVAASRSGKCIRLVELLEEVVASDEQALVFTQFRQMGHALQSMLRHAFDRDVLFLHGGTPQKQREKLVERFQSADGTAPIFLLSLKAGGVGLNLTAASHVFHFDRWWNPAVENQATDRAFRIGQTKTVNVHKFVVTGTLEERIDQMIESKMALAEDVIGSGEDWLTELDSAQLEEMLRLRPEALSDG